MENENEELEITQEEKGGEQNESVSFEDLGLDEYTLKAVQRKGFVTPSPIQVLAIPRLLNGDTNLIARARTGTGKTAAFGLPIIQSIREESDHVEALILEPTRELAMQTCAEMQSFASNGLPRTTVLYGGAPYPAQIRDLKRGCEIVVGTPGRIKDHLERGTLDLSKIKYFILDEGDEMLDMGFIDDIRDIFEKSNIEARILLFSATMPAPILKIAADFMGEYDIIEEEKVIDEALHIEQKYWVVKESEKIEALVRLIDMSPDFYGLVFTMTKMDADKVTRELDLRGYEAAALHGDIMQNQREKVLERFRLKKTRILVATDVAARGIDISGLSHVVNYSLPFDTATYVHRIGRTGRAGTAGTAYTFVRPEERRKLGYFTKNVARATKKELVEDTIPDVKDVLEIKKKRLTEDLKSKLFTLKNIESEQTDAENEIENEAADVAEAALPAEPQVIQILNPALNTATYTELADALCENHDAKEVLTGVLAVFYGEKLSPKHYGRINSKGNGPEVRADQLRVFVSLGKRDGFHAKEIADFFSDMLHIPDRLVDNIDVSQQFSLVSLPIASARQAVEMSKSDRSLPHMHFDSKEEGRGSRKSHGRRGEFRREFSDERPRHSESRREFRTKGNRPNPHTQSERSSSRKNGGAGAYKKGGRKAERF